jgi:hypothetical protein
MLKCMQQKEEMSSAKERQANKCEEARQGEEM